MRFRLRSFVFLLLCLITWVARGQAPVITAFSAPATVGENEGFALFVEATGSSLIYQWRKNGQVIQSGFDATLSREGTRGDAGDYSVVVTNSQGSATSGSIAIAIDSTRPPAIQLHPSNSVYRPYLPANFGLLVQAKGNLPLSYQWLHNGAPVPGATNSFLMLSSTAATTPGSYAVIVSNANGAVISEAASVVVLPMPLPVIAELPASRTVIEGQSIDLSPMIGYSDTGATFQWRKNGMAIPDATSRNFIKSNITFADAGVYSFVVTNETGSVTSGDIYISVAPPRLEIWNHPASLQLSTGDASQRMQVFVAGDMYPLSYQWYRDGQLVPGATSFFLNITNAQPSHAGTYYVVVKDGTGATISSREATISVGASQSPITYISGDCIVEGGWGNGIGVKTASPTDAIQWFKDGSILPGATNSDLIFPEVSIDDAGTYSAQVTNGNGTFTSRPVVVSIRDAGRSPVLTEHPRSRISYPGYTVNFGVYSPGGEGPFSYQWLKDGVPIDGATTSLFSVTNLTAAQTGDYAVRVTNRFGSTTSIPAKLGMYIDELAPVLLPPTSRSLSVGASLSSLESRILNSPGATFQWYRNGILVAGQTSASYRFNSNVPLPGRYSVAVAAPQENSTHELIVALANQGPVFSQQPVRQEKLAGAPVTLAAMASGTGAVSYEWRKNGVPIPGASASNLAFAAAQPSDSGYYSVVATDAQGPTFSQMAQVIVTSGPAPAIDQNPVAQSSYVGTTVTLRVSATGAGSIRYAWYKDEVAIAGQTNATLVLSDLQASDAGSYRVLVTDDNDSTWSAAALVTVQPSPFAGSYTGTFTGGGYWGMEVRPNGRAAFLGYYMERRQLVLAEEFSVSLSGHFSFGQPVGTGADLSGVPTYRFTGAVAGSIASGSIQGQIAGTTAFEGQVIPGPGPGPYTGPTGYFGAVPLAAAPGELGTMIAADGSILFIAADTNGVRETKGSINSAGEFVTAGLEMYARGNLTSGGILKGATWKSSGVGVLSPFGSTGTGQLFNVSTRGVSRGGEGVLTAGFVIVGSGPKDVLIRGVGPTLKDYDVPGWLPNPRLILYNQKGEVLAQNENWDQDAAAAVSAAMGRTGAAALKPGTLDSALHIRLQPGIYTAQVEANGSSGVALAEVYDDSPTSGSRLVNLSTRGTVGRGDDVMILGVNVNAAGARRLLIRAVGPGLKKHDVAGFLEDPKLELYSGQTKILENDNWGDAGSEVEAMSKQLGADELVIGSKDAALLVYLEHGSYTVHAKGVGDTTGIALIEVYEVP